MRKRGFATWPVPLLALLLCGALVAAPVQAKTYSSTENFTQSMDGSTWYVPCANGGDGEDVLLEGDLHTVVHQTQTDAGDWFIVLHFNPTGVVGTGALTGDTYRGVGCTQYRWKVRADELPYTDTTTDNFGMIGQAHGAKFHIKETWQLVVDANGNVRVDFVKSKIWCK